MLHALSSYHQARLQLATIPNATLRTNAFWYLSQTFSAPHHPQTSSTHNPSMSAALQSLAHILGWCLILDCYNLWMGLDSSECWASSSQLRHWYLPLESMQSIHVDCSSINAAKKRSIFFRKIRICVHSGSKLKTRKTYNSRASAVHLWRGMP